MAALPYAVFAWMVAIIAVVGLIGTMVTTDVPADSGNASGITALATGLFVIALVVSMTL